jgi:hypothetical protein
MIFSQEEMAQRAASTARTWHHFREKPEDLAQRTAAPPPRDAM